MGFILISLRNLAITPAEIFVGQLPDSCAFSLQFGATVDLSTRDDVRRAASEIGRAWADNNSVYVPSTTAKAPNRELIELDDVCIIVLMVELIPCVE